MKTFLNLIINLSLFLIAPFLEIVLMPVNVAVVFAKDWKNKGFKGALIGISKYFKESAIRKDVYLCAEYRTLWNITLKTQKGKEIGVNNRTLSADLGEQDFEGTMSRTGATLNWLLFILDHNHCRKSLEYYHKTQKQ